MLDLRLGTIDKSLDDKEVWAGIRRLFDLVHSPIGWKVRLHVSDYPSVGEYPSLHSALTRGFEVTSCLAAYLLLENWSQPRIEDKTGVRLWHPEPYYPKRLEQQYCLKATAHNGHIIHDESLGIVTSHHGGNDWSVRAMRNALDQDSPQDAVRCATEEQAVATALRYAAPWIARYMIEAFVANNQEGP